MAMHVPRAPGFSSMMKDGARFFSGLEEAVIRFVVHKDTVLRIKDETGKTTVWNIYCLCPHNSWFSATVGSVLVYDSWTPPPSTLSYQFCT